MPNARKHVVIVVAILSGSVAVPKLFDYVYPLRSPYNVLVVLGSMAVLLACYWASLNVSPKLVGWVRDAIIFVPYNIWLLLFGNIRQRKILSDIHRGTIALQESALFARLAGLKPGTDRYYIVFTHKDGHDKFVGNNEKYRIPGFPVDEAEIAIRLWYLVATTLNLSWRNIRILCSCCASNAAQTDDVLRHSFAVIGSPKGNQFAQKVMVRMEELENEGTLDREHMYTMAIDDNNSCYLKGRKPDNPDLKPSSTEGPPGLDQILRDY